MNLLLLKSRVDSAKIGLKGVPFLGQPAHTSLHKFQQRINYQGDLQPFLVKVCEDFSIGEYNSHGIIPIGYEDFNLQLATKEGRYFVKIFTSAKDKAECKRNVDIIKKALESGVSHPKLFNSTQGLLYEMTNGSLTDRLCLMEYIDGNIFYEQQTPPTDEEKRFIIKEAALINQMDLHPPFVYDRWAVTNLIPEFRQKGKFLTVEDKKLIELLVKSFDSLSIDKLPHCFVHGDITKTNTMRSKKGEIYIFDFSVANYYPRIQELASILCDLFFDPKHLDVFPKTYDLAVNEYQKYVQLTPVEITTLPTYIKFAHAMHILLANYHKVVNGDTSPENDYYLKLGRAGLIYTNKLWPHADNKKS